MVLKTIEYIRSIFMKNKPFNVYTILIPVLFAVFIATSVFCKIYCSADIPLQIVGALFGSVITVVITSLLLNHQTQKEYEREHDVSIFNKKQEVYHKFLKEVQKIMEDDNLDKKHLDDSIKNIIFHLGRVKMHAKSDIIPEITELLFPLLFTLSRNGKRYFSFGRYPGMAENVYKISKLLGDDLYNKDEKESKILEYASAEKKAVELGVTLGGFMNKQLRSADKMIELHKKYWKLFIDELKRICDENKINISVPDEKKISEQIVLYENEKYPQLDFKIAEKDGHVFNYYIAFNSSSPADCGFETVKENSDEEKKKTDSDYRKALSDDYTYENFGNPGIGAKHIPEEFDIDFYNTNSNYFTFALADENKKKEIVKKFAQMVSDDINVFLDNLKNNSVRL